MSLINQMLRDLERRRRDDAENPLESAIPLIHGSRRRGHPGLLYGLLLLAVVAAILYRLPPPNTSKPAAPPQTETAAKPAAPAGEPPAPIKRVEEAPPVTAAPAPAAGTVPAAPTPEQAAPAQLPVAPQTAETAAPAIEAPAPIKGAEEAPLPAPAPVPPQAAASPPPAASAPALQPQSVAPPAKPAPSLAPLTAQESIESLVQRGSRLAAEGDLAAARAMLERALREQPAHQRSRVLLGRLLIQQNEWAAAAEVVDADPSPRVGGELAQLRARVLMQQGQADRAVAVLEAAHAADPRDEGVLGTLGAAYTDRHYYAKAAAIYRQALARQPAQPRWWLGLAVALDGDRRYDEALQAYREVLARRGLESRVLNYARERAEALTAQQEGR